MKQRFINFYFGLIAKFANFYLKKTKAEVIGITGSVGKTSARMIVYGVLNKFLYGKKVYTSSKNLNGEYGLSLSVLGIEDYVPSLVGLIKTFFKAFYRAYLGEKLYDIVLLEYGIDHVGEMDFLLSIVKPNIGIITTIDKVHCMQMGSPDITAQEKFKMIFGSKQSVFLNIQDSYCKDAYDKVLVDKFFYAVQEKNLLSKESNDNLSDINFDNISFLEGDGLKANFDLIIRDDKKLNITTNLLGKENYGYICLGFTILDIYYFKYFGKSYFELNLEKNIQIDFVLQHGRFSIFDGVGNSVLIDSSYNAAPASMQKMIENVYNIKNSIFKNRDIILALGDMRELGDFTESEHRKIASIIHQIGSYVFLVGESMSRYTKDELEKLGYNMKNVFCFEKSIDAGNKLKEILTNNAGKYIVLFKGSQNTIFMEEALKQVLADPNDVSNLVRQAEWWIGKK